MANVYDRPERVRQRTTLGASESEDTPTTVPLVSGTSTYPNRSIQPLQHDITSESKRHEGRDGAHAVAAAVAHATVPAWINVAFMLALIFGGCCANVFTLEAIVTDMPHAGALITFTQFAITSLLTLPSVVSISAGPGSLFLKKRTVPIRKWVIFTAFFMTVNLMNNSAFLFKISVPLHIIIRSGGPVTSMIIGYLYNSKRYTRVQVLAVSMLSVGVVTAALADASSKGKSLDIGLSDNKTPVMTLVGFAVLGLAMILAAFQGVYADRLYQKYGRDHWREGLFYSHALSLCVLIPTYSKFVPQIKALISSPSILASSPLLASVSSTLFSTASTISSAASAASAASATTSITPPPFPTHTPSQFQPSLLLLLSNPLIHSLLSHIPLKLVYFLLNALTQYLCIRGVYLLSAKSSSLTVTVVLNIRKLVSLILSVYMFGNHLSGGVMAGAAVVFLAGGIYTWEGARLRKRQQMKMKTKSG